MPLPSVDRTTLVNLDNLSYMLGDKELVHPAPPTSPPQPNLGASGPYKPSSPQDYSNIHATLQSIQEEQVSLRAHIQFEHATLHDFV